VKPLLGQPLVSCIIPTKNRPVLVDRAINSVLGQSYDNIEVIVIDDSTNNDTSKVVLQFGNRVTYIKNSQSKGAPYSRNIGLAEAEGDVITFLDDDDIWVQNKTELQLKLLQKYPIVSCDYSTSINAGKTYVRRPRVITFENMLYYNYLGSCSCVMVTADAISNCRFDENIKLGQDWDMWLSIMRSNGIKQAANADEYLVDYNSGEHSRISNAVDPMPVMLKIYDKYKDEHTQFTTKMFYLYNMIPAEKSILVAMAKEMLKIKFNNKSIFYFISLLINKFFYRKTIVY
jgi:glycosyltransferase involved in cell wall biosynthesis